MLRSAEHISVISSEQGFPMFVGAGDIMRGWCLSSVGDAKTGISLLEEGLKKYAATGTKLVVPFYLTVLAEAYGAAAQPKEGLNRIGDAAKLVKTTQERWAEAEMHRVRGSYCSPSVSGLQRRKAIARRSRWRDIRARSFGSYARASTWGDFGATKANASRRVNSSCQSMNGLPKPSTRRSCEMQRRCLPSCDDLVKPIHDQLPGG